MPSWPWHVSIGAVGLHVNRPKLRCIRNLSEVYTGYRIASIYLTWKWPQHTRQPWLSLKYHMITLALQLICIFTHMNSCAIEHICGYLWKSWKQDCSFLSSFWHSYTLIGRFACPCLTDSVHMYVFIDGRSHFQNLKHTFFVQLFKGYSCCPYIVFRFRFLYAFMFVTIYIYIYIYVYSASCNLPH